uniref:Uncharacterized protein n=1 Tax=Ditylenchus dipsaci TaxID=166011 RepID=A0A915EFZ6_9BILA
MENSRFAGSLELRFTSLNPQYSTAPSLEPAIKNCSEIVINRQALELFYDSLQETRHFNQRELMCHSCPLCSEEAPSLPRRSMTSSYKIQV